MVYCFGYRVGPCFLGVKSVKNTAFLAIEKTQKNLSKIRVKITFPRANVSKSRKWNEFGARKKKSKISPSKRLRFKKILKILTMKLFSLPIEKSENVIVKNIYVQDKSEKFP